MANIFYFSAIWDNIRQYSPFLHHIMMLERRGIMVSDLLLSVILCLFSVFLYNLVVYFLKNKSYSWLVDFLFLIGLSFLLLVYPNQGFSFLFLDIPIFIGYGKKNKSVSIIISILISLLFINITSISFMFFIFKYVAYLVTFYVSKYIKNSFFPILIVEKSFFLSFIYFMYYQSFPFGYSFLYLLFLMVVFTFTFSIIFKLLKLGSLDFSLEQLEREKEIFKIVHEIKNPLSVCKGYLDMLDVQNKDKVERYIPIVRGEISRTLTIMDDFMSIRNLKIKQDIFDVYLLIEDVEMIMKSFLKRDDVELVIPKFDDELYLVGDYDRLKQVLINLIKNSYEANASKIEITTRIVNDKFYLEVIDDGEGISKKDLKKIGEMFYTTKTKGTGIGVHFSKEIISLHHGTMKYFSKLNNGTKVKIKLPVVKELL